MTISVLSEAWLAPLPEFSLARFGFWHDDLTEAELTRRMAHDECLEKLPFMAYNMWITCVGWFG